MFMPLLFAAVLGFKISLFLKEKGVDDLGRVEAPKEALASKLLLLGLVE